MLETQFNSIRYKIFLFVDVWLKRVSNGLKVLKISTKNISSGLIYFVILAEK